MTLKGQSAQENVFRGGHRARSESINSKLFSNIRYCTTVPLINERTFFFLLTYFPDDYLVAAAAGRRSLAQLQEERAATDLRFAGTSQDGLRRRRGGAG
jgi:hypothetical protein